MTSPRRSSHRILVGQANATDELTPHQRYSILENCRSYLGLSVLGRIKLEEQIRSLSHKGEAIKEEVNQQPQPPTHVVQYPIPEQKQFLAEPPIPELTAQQKLVQRKLRNNNLEYEKMLIEEAELDIQLAEEKVRNNHFKEIINRKIAVTQELKKQIQQKKALIRKGENDIKMCYVHIGRRMDPQDPEKQYRLKVQREHEQEEYFRQAVERCKEQSASYDKEIVDQSQQLEGLNRRIENVSQLIQKSKETRERITKRNQEIEFQNKIAKLEFEKLSFCVDSIKQQKEELEKWIGYIEDFLKICQEVKQLPNIHINFSSQIESQIIEYIKKDCSNITYQFPKLRISIRQSQAKSSKLKYRIQVQNKKIAFLQAKIARISKAVAAQAPEQAQPSPDSIYNHQE